MKRITTILSLIMVVAIMGVSCKDKASEKIVADNVESAVNRDEAAKMVPVMTFDRVEHDFGTIQRGEAQETVFSFTNTGNAPLIITDAKSSCGCTVPNPPKDPIAGSPKAAAPNIAALPNGDFATFLTALAAFFTMLPKP